MKYPGRGILLLFQSVFDILPFILQRFVHIGDLPLHTLSGLIDLRLDLRRMFFYFVGKAFGAFRDLFLDLLFGIVDLPQPFAQALCDLRQLIGAEEHEEHNYNDEYFTSTKIQKKKYSA